MKDKFLCVMAQYVDMTIVFLGCVSYNPISDVARVRY